MLEVVRIGVTKITKENKLEIFQKFEILKQNDIQQTQPRKKQSISKIYIKVISSESNNVRMKIVNLQGKNKLQYGDYYVLQQNEEYIMFNLLQFNEEYILIFNEQVSIEWIPDFPIELDNDTNIKVMRRGEYFPQNQYFYDGFSCERSYLYILCVISFRNILLLPL
ncbi:Hypothetical_protein [Hexamita inflata]|uniref:Hypothetical_protein n=1 Tax=Hexamita inflata TaxID=28002 RepID=A0AA86NXS2_9EUKA|nr:Hypothetical protein HINF_LOCUS14690 [Hexamita inflata]